MIVPGDDHDAGEFLGIVAQEAALLGVATEVLTDPLAKALSKVAGPL